MKRSAPLLLVAFVRAMPCISGFGPQQPLNNSRRNAGKIQFRTACQQRESFCPDASAASSLASSRWRIDRSRTSQRESCCLGASVSKLASFSFSGRKKNDKPTRTKKDAMQNERRKREDELVSRDIYKNALHRLFFNCLIKMIALATRFVMCVMNKTVVHDEDRQLERAVLERPDDVGLLTVSNHQSMADDPAIWCSGALPFRALGTKFGRSIVMVQEFYYCLGRFSAFLFHGLKCIPIRRGDLRGMESPTLEALHARLNGKVKLQAGRKNGSRKKEWCHIMVEGRILQPWRFDPAGRPRLGRLRHGAAKLIACSPPSTTIVVPIFHDGLALILPETPPPDATVIVRTETGEIPQNKPGKTERWFAPRSGQRCNLFIGDPIDFSDLVPPDGFPFREKIRKEVLETISDRLRTSLLKLEKRAADNRQELNS